MLILTLRTDKPEAEVGLFFGKTQLIYKTWHAHRALAETLHRATKEILQRAGKNWQDLDGIVCFAGPGSFTGLRIGISVGNALAYSLDVPIVGAVGENWISKGTKKLQNGQNDKIVIPVYGSNPHVTSPKK